jgi:hypothetical protein
VASRYIRVNEYTWVGVNYMQALLGEVKRVLDTRKKAFDYQPPRSSKL